MAKYLTPGSRINRLPARSLNRAIDAGERMHHMGPPGDQDPTPFRGDSPRLVVLVKNMTGQDLIERSIVGIKETALDLPDITAPSGPDPGNLADASVLTGEAVDVELPDPAKHTAGKWGVTLGPIAAGEEGAEGHGWMAIGGLIKARVDVTDAAHAFAVPILNETEHLASAASGTPVTWRKTGTGKRWAQLNLGSAGGDTGNVIYAQVVGAVATGDPTFTFDNAISVVGSIPAGGTDTAQNQYAQTYVDNEWVFLFQEKSGGQWLTERGGTSGSQVVYFELTQNKSYSDAAKLAKPVLPDGTLDSGADAFHVVDDHNQFYGRAAESGAEGYRGFALRFTDDYLEGVPGYRIITMEGPAHWFIATLTEAWSMSTTACSVGGDQIWGRPFRGRRLPPSGNIDVYDDLSVAIGGVIGDKWLVAWDEADEHYIFVVPLTSKLTILKATVNNSGGVRPADATFGFDAAVALQGTSPGTGTANNTYSETYADNEVVTLVKRADNGQFETIKKGDAFVVLKGSPSTSVTRSNSTFTCTSPTLVHGNVPVGSITVANSPELKCGTGDTVYFVFDLTAGSTNATRWTTAHPKNHVFILRGYSGYAEATGEFQGLVHNDAGQMQWLGGTICNPVP